MAKGRKTGGRKPGTPNKVSGKVKASILDTFDGIGGVKTFKAWAKDNPGEFYTKILVKILPTEISGPDGDAIPVTGVFRWGGVEIPL